MGFFEGNVAEADVRSMPDHIASICTEVWSSLLAISVLLRCPVDAHRRAFADSGKALAIV